MVLIIVIEKYDKMDNLKLSNDIKMLTETWYVFLLFFFYYFNCFLICCRGSFYGFDICPSQHICGQYLNKKKWLKKEINDFIMLAKKKLFNTMVSLFMILLL